MSFKILTGRDDRYWKAYRLASFVHVKPSRLALQG